MYPVKRSDILASKTQYLLRPKETSKVSTCFNHMLWLDVNRRLWFSGFLRSFLWTSGRVKCGSQFSTACTTHIWCVFCFVNNIHDWIFSHLSHLSDLILSRSSSVVMQDCKTFNGAHSSNQRHKASLSYRITWPGTNDEQFGRRWCVPSWARPARVAHLCGILVKFGITPQQDKWFKKSDSCSCACASNIDL